MTRWAGLVLSGWQVLGICRYLCEWNERRWKQPKYVNSFIASHILIRSVINWKCSTLWKSMGTVIRFNKLVLMWWIMAENWGLRPKKFLEKCFYLFFLGDNSQNSQSPGIFVFSDAKNPTGFFECCTVLNILAHFRTSWLKIRLTTCSSKSARSTSKKNAWLIKAQRKRESKPSSNLFTDISRSIVTQKQSERKTIA